MKAFMLMLVICADAACGGNRTSAPAVTPTSSQTPIVTPIPAKTAMRGLLDMGDISFYQDSPSALPTNDPEEVQPFASSFGGIVINATWAQLQPSGNTPLADNNPIDQALQAVTTYNQANPNHPLLVKLRVWGGLAAPNWVKSQALCGQTQGPINVT